MLCSMIDVHGANNWGDSENCDNFTVVNLPASEVEKGVGVMFW